MYTSLNQYHVVMEAAPQYWQNPRHPARRSTCASPSGQQVPLSAFAALRARQSRRLRVNHQGLFPAVTISFNLQPGVALGDAVDAIDAAAAKVGLPATIQTGFAGTAQAYQDSLGSEPYPDRRGAGGRLPRARHSLRKLHSSDHDSVHAALGRRGRAAGAACSRKPT